MKIDLIYEEILLYHFKDFENEYIRKIVAKENPIQHILENDNAKKVRFRLLVSHMK